MFFLRACYYMSKYVQLAWAMVGFTYDSTSSSLLVMAEYSFHWCSELAVNQHVGKQYMFIFYVWDCCRFGAKRMFPYISCCVFVVFARFARRFRRKNDVLWTNSAFMHNFVVFRHFPESLCPPLRVSTGFRGEASKIEVFEKSFREHIGSNAKNHDFGQQNVFLL